MNRRRNEIGLEKNSNQNSCDKIESSRFDVRCTTIPSESAATTGAESTEVAAADASFDDS